MSRDKREHGGSKADPEPKESKRFPYEAPHITEEEVFERDAVMGGCHEAGGCDKKKAPS